MDILCLLRELIDAGVIDIIQIIVLPLSMRWAILGGVRKRI